MQDTKMSMKTPIRKIEGLVRVNFFDNQDINAEVELTSRAEKETPDLFDRYRNQVLVEGILIERKFACLDDGNKLSQQLYPLGQSDYVGWWGTVLSGKTKDNYGNYAFPSPQYIRAKYSASPTLQHIIVRGDKPRQQYPTKFILKITYTKQEKWQDTKIREPDQEFNTVTYCKEIEIENIGRLVRYVRTYVDQTNNINTDYDGRDLLCTFDKRKQEYVITTLTKNITTVELIIEKWSAPGELARINFLGADRVEDFYEDKLQSLEVLEEKTSAVDKLSYGITSNYCNFKFYNDNYKYFEPEYFSRLSKNREIFPYIRCLGGLYSPLGRFYSDDWKVPSDSQYITCKGYDVLYSLKEITINYGMLKAKYGYVLYKDQTLIDVIKCVEGLINDQRAANGIIGSRILLIPENIPHELTLPYTLIEEKSAWDVLQDIANLACAYVYVNRYGDIIIERDNFDDAPKAESGVTIDMDNAFSYSLPVTSKNIVNQVQIDYYEWVTDTSDERYDIKPSELVVGDDGRIYFTINLKKIYRGIRNEEIDSAETVGFELYKVSYNAFTFVLFSKKLYNKDIPVVLKSSENKLEKKTYTISNSESIKKYGLKELKISAGASMDKTLALANAKNILNKYSDGVEYLQADWTGDDALELSTKFKGDKEQNKKRKTFECLSNEFKLSGSLRAKTKGIQI